MVLCDQLAKPSTRTGVREITRSTVTAIPDLEQGCHPPLGF